MQKILKRIEQDSAPEYLRTNCLVSRHPLSSLAKRGFFCSCMNAWHLGFLPVAPPHCNGEKCASQRRHPIIIKRIKEPKKCMLLPVCKEIQEFFFSCILGKVVKGIERECQKRGPKFRLLLLVLAVGEGMASWTKLGLRQKYIATISDFSFLGTC